VFATPCGSHAIALAHLDPGRGRRS